MSSISFFDIVSVVIPDLTIFDEFLHLMLLLLLFAHFWPTTLVHYSSMINAHLEMAKKATKKITCIFLIVGFLVILNLTMNTIKNYVEN